MTYDCAHSKRAVNGGRNEGAAGDPARGERAHPADRPLRLPRLPRPAPAPPALPRVPMGGRRMNNTVSAVNALTARWARGTRQGTVFSAAGVWPLLALLAAGAAGPARDELSRAVGMQADQAAAGARELLAGLDSMSGVGSALGLWTDRAL